MNVRLQSKCPEHKNRWAYLYCLHPDCVYKPLCQYCLNAHPKSHFPFIYGEDTDEFKPKESSLVNNISKLKSKLFDILNESENNAESTKAEFTSLCKNIKKSFLIQLENLKSTGLAMIEAIQLNMKSQISKLNENLVQHLKALDQTPKKDEKLLDLQIKLHEQRFPKLENELRKISDEAKKGYPRISFGSYSSYMEQSLKSILDVKKVFGFTPLNLEPNRSIPNKNMSKSAYFPQNELNPTNNTSSYREIKKVESIRSELICYDSDIILTLCYMPKHNILAVAGASRLVNLFIMEDYSMLRSMPGHEGDIWSLIELPSDNLLVSGSADKTIRFWDHSRGDCIRVLSAHTDVVRCLAYDGLNLISGGADSAIRIWDLSLYKCLKACKGHAGVVRTLSVLSGHGFFASGGADSIIRIWEKESGVCVKSMSAHSGDIWSLCFLEDLELLVSGGFDKSIKVWDAATWSLLKVMDGHSDTINSIVYNKDSKKIVSASSDRMIRIWNIHTGECISKVIGHKDLISKIAKAGEHIVSASWDKTVRVWMID